MLSAEAVSTDLRFLVGYWGDFENFYDWGFEESGTDENNAGDHFQIDSHTRSDGHFETWVPDGGVKVLSEKTGSVDNFRDDGLDSESIPVCIDGLSEEFGGLLQMN
jgi:hypothetical protein